MPFIANCEGNRCTVHCLTVIYDFDEPERVEDWYEISPLDCSKSYGLSNYTFNVELVPFLKELKEWGRDQSSRRIESPKNPLSRR